MRKIGSIPLVALLAGAALGACGGGLYDATGVPALAAGGGATCDADQVTCNGDCTTPSVDACGTACAPCTTTVAHAIPVCAGQGAASACGYECADPQGRPEGYLRCSAGCCTTIALAAGPATTCALLSSGEVACWGAGYGASPRLVSLPGAAGAVAVGTSHACALLGDGSVRCWGSNASGQLGGTPVGGVATPIAANATAVAAGGEHACAVVSGAVRCWGANGAGQVTGTAGANVPAPASAPVGSGATAVAGGAAHTCALLASGAVQCWGANASGQLGGTPAGGLATPLGAAVTAVSASADQVCAAQPSNRQNLDVALQCWGDAFGDALADVNGWFLASPQPTPGIPRRDATRATIQSTVTLLAAGAHHVCVRLETLSLECLGANDRGQLGGPLADGPGRTVVVTLPAAGGPAATALAAGTAHTCAASGDGRLRCWGANDAGQLGDGTTTNPTVGDLRIPLGQ